MFLARRIRARTCKRTSVRSYANKKPLTIEITTEMRERINEQWYWAHRDKIVSDPRYKKKVVLIDNGQVVAVFDSVTPARTFQESECPECFLTMPGAEDFYKHVIVVGKRGRSKSSEILLQDVDILPANFREPLELAMFQPESQFYGGNERPYITLPLQVTGYPNLQDPVLPTWFLVDTGSPFTFITKETASKIFGTKEPDVFLEFLAPYCRIWKNESCSISS